MTTFFCDDCGKPFKAKVTGIFCPACCRKRNGYKFGEWIPVREKLPENDTAVIVATDHEMVFQCLYAYDGWDLWEGYPVNITHWMPLPEPPKEDNYDCD